MNNNIDYKCIKFLKKFIKVGKVLVSFFFILNLMIKYLIFIFSEFLYLNICFILYVFIFLGYLFEKDRFWLKDDGFGYLFCFCDKFVLKFLKKLDCSCVFLDRSLSIYFLLEFIKVG